MVRKSSIDLSAQTPGLAGALGLALILLLAGGPGLHAQECDGPEALEPWDWEVVPEEVVAGDIDDCGGGAPVEPPAIEQYFGDSLPEAIESVVYGLELDLTDLTLDLGDQLAVFQIRSDEDLLMATLLLIGGTAEPALRIVWIDDSLVVQTHNIVVSPDGKLVTVRWVEGESGTSGSLEVEVDGISGFVASLDNDELEMAQARIGVVDATRHPGSSAGSFVFFPRVKHWDF